jgi:RimJ/RimL family protein N-acetyltransferase
VIVRLVPLSRDFRDAIDALQDDSDVQAFTRFPVPREDDFADRFISRYEDGLAAGTRAGFAAVDEHGTFVGLGLAPDIDENDAEMELGYAVAPAARGSGVGSEILRQMTDWAFATRGMMRLILVIDVNNVASQRMAERCGYQLEGVMRSIGSRPGRRMDAQLWSRLPTDPPAAPVIAQQQ